MDIRCMTTCVTDNLLKFKSFKLKGRLYTLTVLEVLSVEVDVFDEQLCALIEKAPRLFEQAPIVLDCTAISEANIDLAVFCHCVRSHGLFPIAVQGGSVLFHARAAALGLAILRGSAAHDKAVMSAQEMHPKAEMLPSNVGVPTNSGGGHTKIMTTPVRSGQQVFSQGDLIVAASVGRGAELLAEGHIHVYCAL